MTYCRTVNSKTGSPISIYMASHRTQVYICVFGLVCFMLSINKTAESRVCPAVQVSLRLSTPEQKCRSLSPWWCFPVQPYMLLSTSPRYARVSPQNFKHRLNLQSYTSTIATPQLDFSLWIPNCPPAMMRPPPQVKGVVTEDDIMSFLPDMNSTCRVLTLITLLSQPALDFVRFHLTLPTKLN